MGLGLTHHDLIFANLSATTLFLNEVTFGGTGGLGLQCIFWWGGHNPNHSAEQPA